MSSFPFSRVAIIGSNGAIGRAFCDMCVEKHIEKLYTFSRSQQTQSSHIDGHCHLDITSETSIEMAAATIDDGELDLIVVTTGVLHTETIKPEKSLRDLTADACENIFRINTIGPALVAKHFLPKLRAKKRAVFAVLSARVGSIEDNRLGGWYSYRSSKAALSMMIKTASIEWQRNHKEAVIVGLHPGTVDSNLSKPFQQHIKPGTLLSPAESVEALCGVLTTLSPADSGKQFAWSGERIPY